MILKMKYLIILLILLNAVNPIKVFSQSSSALEPRYEGYEAYFTNLSNSENDLIVKKIAFEEKLRALHMEESSYLQTLDTQYISPGNKVALKVKTDSELNHKNKITQMQKDAHVLWESYRRSLQVYNQKKISIVDDLSESRKKNNQLNEKITAQENQTKRFENVYKGNSLYDTFPDNASDLINSRIVDMTKADQNLKIVQEKDDPSEWQKLISNVNAGKEEYIKNNLSNYKVINLSVSDS